MSLTIFTTKLPFTAVAVFILINSSSHHANAKLECDETVSCDELLNTTGSKCRDGQCTNPFAGGCLRKMLGREKYSRLRICNSDDREDAEGEGLCTTEPLERFDYTEIRISPNDWESSIFYAWILQIVLSEMLDVPASIETGGLGDLSFYDLFKKFDYPESINNFDFLERANKVEHHDCRNIYRESEACAHVLPEVWQQRAKQPEDWNAVEPDFNGISAQDNWYIPVYTVMNDTSLASFLGLKGEENRKKLAQKFKRPTTWADYCNEVSSTNCTEPDDYARQRPKNDEDGRSYFVEGKYTGYFRTTEKNDCSTNPKCTGHIVDTPCTWAAKTDTQIYWNNIMLEDDIEYTYGEMMQVFRAANATKSDVIIVWWYPEPTISEYDYFPISLPLVTNECLENRPVYTNNTRCGASPEELIGANGKGSCGYSARSIERFFASSLRDSFLNTPEVERSPAYQFLRNFQMSETDMNELLFNWATRGNDKFGYDPRHAVCSWVAANINGNIADNNNTKMINLTQFLPLGYPRQIREDEGYSSSLMYSALALSGLSVLVVVATFGATYHYRMCRVMRLAQVPFLYLFCLGYLLVCIGAVLKTFQPSRGTCIAKGWIILLGYTVGNVPLLVKTAAISYLMQSAQKMRRVQISRSSLFWFVGISVLIISSYLGIWTALASPSMEEIPVLRSATGDSNVDLYAECSTSQGAWAAVAFAWQALYIVFAAILAFQSKNVKQEFNESRMVGNMAYVSFVFLLVRTTTQFIPVELIKPSVREGVTSMLLSFDSSANLLVYFGPKFWLLKVQKDKDASSRMKSINCVASISVPQLLSTFDPRIGSYRRDKSHRSIEYCSNCKCAQCKLVRGSSKAVAFAVDTIETIEAGNEIVGESSSVDKADLGVGSYTITNRIVGM